MPTSSGKYELEAKRRNRKEITLAVDPLDIFFDEPERIEWCSLSQLRENYDITFEDSGWYSLSNGDFALVIERRGKYKVWLWVRCDPRNEMEKILDLPTFQS